MITGLDSICSLNAKNSIVIVFLVFQLGSTQDINESANTTISKEPEVSNITIFPIYDETWDTISLNVSWMNSKGIISLKHIINIGLYNEGKSYCKTGGQERHISSNKTSIILGNDYLEPLPGCSYKVKISGDQVDEDAPYIIYTVPDCVAERCVCFYQNPAEPIVTLQQISTDTIRIFWMIPEQTNTTTIYFSVKQGQREVAALTRNVSGYCASRRCHEDVPVPGMAPGTLYHLEVWYTNTTNCESSRAYLSYHAQVVEESQLVYQVMISLTFGLMFVFSLWLVWKWRSNCLRDRCFASNSFPTKLAIPMEKNHLYVEKEKARNMATCTEHGLDIVNIVVGGLLDIVVFRHSGFDTLRTLNGVVLHGVAFTLPKEALVKDVMDSYEVNSSQLQLGSQIGGGAFGQVFLARLPPYTTVAVKMLKNSASSEELEEFRQEIAMLKRCHHPNIVTLLGCCTIRQPYCMIMEYIPYGDLLKYLHNLRSYYERDVKHCAFRHNGLYPQLAINEMVPGNSPNSFNRLPPVLKTEYTVLECLLDSRDLQSFAVQIARGMRYLAYKQIVHRDLAARNILIDENKTLKISDFGLSRTGIYVNSKHKMVPLRWLSIEAIRDHLYTSKSDVWAYGIVLWEIGTLGGMPYPNLRDAEILGFLMSGKRLEKPENCTSELYALMLRCWNSAKDARPSFMELLVDLKDISSKRRVYVDFSQLNPAYMFPPAAQLSSNTNANEDNIEICE